VWRICETLLIGFVFVCTCGGCNLALRRRTQLLMHNQDQDMLLMKPGDDKTIFKMDVERGQVVDEWVCSGEGQPAACWADNRLQS
jgi:hypothetical protein